MIVILLLLGAAACLTAATISIVILRSIQHISWRLECYRPKKWVEFYEDCDQKCIHSPKLQAEIKSAAGKCDRGIHEDQALK